MEKRQWTNLGWRRALECSLCKEKRQVVRIADKYEYNTRCISICAPCLARLLLEVVTKKYEKIRRKKEDL